MPEDHYDAIPSRFSVPIAALILKTTPEALDSFRRTGAIRVETAIQQPRYHREELERILGRKLSLADWLDAEKAHQPRREASQRYNSKRQATRAPSAGPAKAHR
jgi:hypothetical protein